ncbi:RNA polymerase II elongation factor ELL-like isoform X1 [Mytilus trossulus]|uniref:RNA polymerase II elongation factor ELL-like isoform X1 n=2 Tax=Mytilus trossulus TaxID=6551 RepID=UPI0030078C35
MAALVEGQKYGLSSNFSLHDQKTVVQVRLTDSALKAIEEYLKLKNASNTKPSIQFQGSQGVITIPKKSSDDSRTFQFSLASLSEPGYDCVQQSAPSNGNHMVLEGSMTNKMTVKGTSDVFQQTREQMKSAQEEYCKVRTQEIKHSGPNISKRVKHIIKNPKRELDTSHPKPSPTISAINQNKPKPTVVSPMPVAAPVHAPVPQRQPPTNLSVPVPVPTRQPPANVAAPVPVPQRQAPTNLVTSTTTSALHRNNAVPSSNVNKGFIPSSTKPASTVNPAVMQKPFRERLLHLLAVRPFKKPELLVRLKRDGMKEKDKDSFGQHVTSVASLNPRDNKYYLLKHLYADVSLDWPFYSDSDKDLVKSKLQSLSPSASPASHPSPDSPTSSIPQKRPIEPATVELPPSKKQKRISHYDKTIKSKQEVTSSVNGHDRKHTKENIDDSSNVDSTTSDLDFVNKYNNIMSMDQRNKYKQEFNLEYEEYRNLHKNVEKVTQKFADLEVKMRQTQQGTEEFEKLKELIRTEYKVQKEDIKYIEQKKRFEYLHKKLGFIKELILDYDRSQAIVDS